MGGNLFIGLFVGSYLVVWSHFAYGLVLGPIHQLITHIRTSKKRNETHVRTEVSRGPLSSEVELPERMYVWTAAWSWFLCAVGVVAFAIFPYMLFAGLGSLVPQDKRGASWWDLICAFHAEHVADALAAVGAPGAIALFAVVNREIFIMAGLALFVRWPKLNPDLLMNLGRSRRRKSVYNDEGSRADDTLTATLERHRSVRRRTSQISKMTRVSEKSDKDNNLRIVTEVSGAAGRNEHGQHFATGGVSPGGTPVDELIVGPRQTTSRFKPPVPIDERHSFETRSSDDGGLTLKNERDYEWKAHQIDAFLDQTINGSHITANPIALDLHRFTERPYPLRVDSMLPWKTPAMRPSKSSPHLNSLEAQNLFLPEPKPLPVAHTRSRLSVDVVAPTITPNTNSIVHPRPTTSVGPRPSTSGPRPRLNSAVPRPPSLFRHSTSLGSLTSWGSSTPTHAVPFKGLRHAIIIACHNSSEVLVGTIGRLLQLVEPKAIFLADNGSSDEEVMRTKQVAGDLSSLYRHEHPEYTGLGINVGVLKTGSKTIAQFSVLNSLAYLRSDIEFVSLLDDDTVFPEDWSEQYTLNMFDESSDCHCLAYPLGAEKSPTMGLLGHFQDFEYRISMFTKIAQATISSALFPSGAVSTWRAITLLDILSRHDTMFRGDDLQMGLLMHTLYNEIKFLNPEEVHRGNYAIRVAPFTIPTMVPVHWFHLKDLFPKVYWKHLPNCSCGEPSLFYQRARSWEVARHRFFGKFSRVCIHDQRMKHLNTWFAKICALDSVIGILNDFAQMGMVLYVLLQEQNGVIIGILSVVSLAFQMLAFDLLNVLVIDRNPKTEIPCEIRVLYPICYTPILNIIIKHAALVYNYFHYTPMVRNLAVISTQARKENLDTMWTSWSPYTIAEEQSGVLRDVAQRIRDIEKAKRFRMSIPSRSSNASSPGNTKTACSMPEPFVDVRPGHAPSSDSSSNRTRVSRGSH
ncbi:hypothetical protein DFJ77DRAFT_345437 [Powellomyces hirtus]|nr:hypothetical protein DFJ77DRAFT_345437 [Powellomyces hirtus]